MRGYVKMIDFDKTKEVEAIHRYISEGKYINDENHNLFIQDLLNHLGVERSPKANYLVEMAFKYGFDGISLHAVVFTAEDLLPLIVMI